MNKSWRIKYHLYRSFWAGIDFLFPPLCGGCGKSGTRWCWACREVVTLIPDPKCEICGLPQTDVGICPSCQQTQPYYQKLRSWVVFEGTIRKALHKMKYRQDLGLGDSLAVEMFSYTNQLNWNVDIVLPVPLGKERMKKRGYNQVSLFALPLALAMGWKYNAHVLKRAKETISQVGLSKEERKNNVHDAFVANSRKVEGKSVLIMDDVSTTGATLNSCAKALIDGGASEVYALSLARALPHHGLKTV